MSDLLTKRAWEVLVARLGGVVCRHARAGDISRSRRHDEHVAAPLDDRWQSRAHGMEDTDQIDIDEGFESPGVDLEHRSVNADAGVSHHDVDATESVDRSTRCLLHRRQVTHVGGECQHAVTVEVAGDVVQGRLVQIGQHHLGAFGMQATTYCGANAVAAAGDEDDLAVYRAHGGEPTAPRPAAHRHKRARMRVPLRRGPRSRVHQ